MVMSSSKVLFDASFSFDNVPLASCSKEMIHGLFSTENQDQKQYVCFNGSSEEIKEQIATHYLNSEIKNLLEKNYSAKKILRNKKSIFNNIKKKIIQDALEVRIPTHVAVDKREKVNLE